MPWAKVGDEWWCHPKVLGLGLAPRGLWISALSWSCQQRRDVVPAGFVGMVGGSDEDAAALVECGLWVVADGGWRIHDWSHYQAATVSEKRAEAGRKGGLASGKGKQTEASAKQTEAKVAFASEANGQAGPIPSLPVPSQPILSLTPEALLDAVVARRLTEVRKTVQIKSPAAWCAKVRAGLADEIDDTELVRLIDTYDEPAAVLAEVIDGARDRRWLKRREVVA